MKRQSVGNKLVLVAKPAPRIDLYKLFVTPQIFSSETPNNPQLPQLMLE